MITQEQLKELFIYRDGNLYWRVRLNSRSSLKKPAGSIKKVDGYRRIGINKTYYYAHRLIWIYHYGEVPLIIDHINGDRSDNRIENLRIANTQQNGGNRFGTKESRSKYKGVVSQEARSKKNPWKATIKYDGKTIHLGCYKTEEEAAMVYDSAAIRLFGPFAKTNQIIFN